LLLEDVDDLLVVFGLATDEISELPSVSLRMLFDPEPCRAAAD